VHLASIVADSFVPFGWTEVLVPFASTWRPGAVAWGIVAFDLLVVVEATSLLIHRLPRRAWYVVHLSSYALFACASVHGLLAGTDTANAFVRWGGAVGLALVVFVLVLRLPAGVAQDSERSTESSSGGSGSSKRSRAPVTG
jgi:DMSO/TMAO reductase YedYZ heme-binding membrane subunit